MDSPFSPTRQDVDRYRRLRAVSKALNHKLVKTVPRDACYEIGEAIGILHQGRLVFDTEDVSDVLMDCCLHEWFEEGKNLIQRYGESHPATLETDESYLLNAYLEAKYRIIAVKSAVPGAGVYCRDVLNGEDLFVMDLAFSQSVKSGDHDSVIATRTIPLGEYAMTSGTGLPITSKKSLADAMSVGGKQKTRGGSVALGIVRTCLAAGAAQNIRYEGTDPKPAGPKTASPRREPKHRWGRR